MSVLMTIAKFYARVRYRKEDELDSLATQKKLSLPDPPRKFARRCRQSSIAGIKTVWIDETNAENGVLVYLHGGAYYFGPVKEHWDYIATISEKTQMAALMIDYGMAPLYPFPAGIVDTLKVIEHEQLQKYFLLGDSSGAAMVVAAALRLKEAGKQLPKKIILMSPWIDASLENPEVKIDERKDPFMTAKRLATVAKEYAGGADLKDPEISPMFADLDGLPPTLIQVGTADLLISDCRKFHQRCIASGVDVKYEEFPDAFHDFMMLNVLPEAKKAITTQSDFLCSE